MMRLPPKLRESLRDWGIIVNVLSFGIVVLFLAAIAVRCGWDCGGDARKAAEATGRWMAE